MQLKLLSDNLLKETGRKRKAAHLKGTIAMEKYKKMKKVVDEMK